jgi:hypothetical protein
MTDIQEFSQRINSGEISICIKELSDTSIELNNGTVYAHRSTNLKMTETIEIKLEVPSLKQEQTNHLKDLQKWFDKNLPSQTKVTILQNTQQGWIHAKVTDTIATDLIFRDTTYYIKNIISGWLASNNIEVI